MKNVCLSDIAQIVMGQSPPSSTYNNSGDGLPFFQGKTDFGDLYPTARVFCNSPQKVSEPGDILISVRAPVGPTNISREQSCIGRGLAAIRCSEHLDNRYLLFFLRYYEPRLVMSSDGSTFDAISRDDLEQIPLLLPPLPEQQRIAAILEKADRLRRLRRYALEVGETFLQSVFLEMFGDPRSEGYGIPLVPLKDICKKITDGTHVTPKYQDAGIPFLSVKNLTRIPGQLDFSDVKYISREEHEKISKLTNVEKGDILYTKVGTYGIPQIVDTDIEFSIFVSVALLKPRPEKVIPKFLEAALRTNYVKSQADRLVSGIGVPDLHLREIRTILIPLPDKDEQGRFVAIVQKFERLRSQQREALRQAEHLFQTLLHQEFNDQL